MEIMQAKSCVRFTSGRVECLGANSFAYSFCFTNNWTNTVYHLAVLDLPAGVSLAPGPVLDFPAGIAPGQGLCTNVTVTTSPGSGVGSSLCFRLAFHTLDFADCCLVSNCLTLPECCLPPVGETKVDCDPATGVMTYSFSFQNNSGQTMGALYLLQANPPCFALAPSSFNLVPPLPNGGITNVTFTLVKTNTCGDELCLKLLALNTNSTECCLMDRCVELPKCRHPGDISSDLKTVVVTYPPGTKVAEVRFLLDDVLFGRATLPPFEAAFPLGISLGLHAVVI